MKLIKTPFRRLPAPKVIAVDVDGTLIIAGKPNQQLIQRLKAYKNEGHSLFLWSMRGREHCIKAAEFTETTDLFDQYLGKPGIIFDDQGWNWARQSKVNPITETPEPAA